MKKRVLLLALALVLAACALPAAARDTPALHGTFLQPLRAQAALPAEHWERLFTALAEAGVKSVVVQWTVHEHTPFYDSKAFGPAVFPLVRIVADQCARHGMSYRLGLVEDPNWWSMIKREPVLLDLSLFRLRERHLVTARELAPLVAHDPAFAGWFIPQEIDDASFAEREKRALLGEHLALLGAELAPLAPGRGLAVSGFSNAFADPTTLAAFWRDLLRDTGFDLLLFQDGVGAGKLRPEDAAIYLHALGTGLLNSGVRLAPVVEIFEQTDGPPLNDRPFAARPVSMDVLAARLAMDFSVSQEVFAFSMPEYMSPTAGPKAARLYRDYLDWLKRP